jgi:hypothetical protein
MLYKSRKRIDGHELSWSPRSIEENGFEQDPKALVRFISFGQSRKSGPARAKVNVENIGYDDDSS